MITFTGVFSSYFGYDPPDLLFFFFLGFFFGARGGAVWWQHAPPQAEGVAWTFWGDVGAKSCTAGTAESGERCVGDGGRFVPGMTLDIDRLATFKDAGHHRCSK